MHQQITLIPHLDLPTLKKRFRHGKHADNRLRWLIIYTLSAMSRPGHEVAQQLGCSRRLVTLAVKEYNALGAKAFAGPGKGSGRTRAHLSEAEEIHFLQPFVRRAQRGLITRFKVIHLAFEQKVGRSVDASVISRLLKRHQWRKLVPRPYHPKQNKQRLKVFKKNLPT